MPPDYCGTSTTPQKAGLRFLRLSLSAESLGKGIAKAGQDMSIFVLVPVRVADRLGRPTCRSFQDRRAGEMGINSRPRFPSKGSFQPEGEERIHEQIQASSKANSPASCKQSCEHCCSSGSVFCAA